VSVLVLVFIFFPSDDTSVVAGTVPIAFVAFAEAFSDVSESIRNNHGRKHLII
jgi:hypothetical protein